MTPESFDELLMLFDEVIDELRTARDGAMRAFDAEFDQLVCDLRDALDRYEEAITVD